MHKTLHNQRDYDKNMILKFLYPNLAEGFSNRRHSENFQKDASVKEKIIRFNDTTTFSSNSRNSLTIKKYEWDKNVPKIAVELNIDTDISKLWNSKDLLLYLFHTLYH